MTMLTLRPGLELVACIDAGVGAEISFEATPREVGGALMEMLALALGEAVKVGSIKLLLTEVAVGGTMTGFVLAGAGFCGAMTAAGTAMMSAFSPACCVKV